MNIAVKKKKKQPTSRLMGVEMARRSIREVENVLFRTLVEVE